MSRLLFLSCLRGIVLLLSVFAAAWSGAGGSVWAQGVAARGTADVAWAKEVLKQLGFDPGRADGVVTELFTRRLRDYQAARGLTASGQLDQPTVDRLLAERPTAATQGTLAFNPNQPPPAPAPAAQVEAAPMPRAAPAAPVASERSSADPGSLAVIARNPAPPVGGPRSAAQGGGPPAGPRVSQPSPQPAVPSAANKAAPGKGDPATEARVSSILASQPLPAPVAGAPAAVETTSAANPDTLASWHPPGWLGWVGVAGLFGFCVGFAALWWRSGQPEETGGLITLGSAMADLAGRQEPSFGRQPAIPTTVAGKLLGRRL